MNFDHSLIYGNWAPDGGFTAAHMEDANPYVRRDAAMRCLDVGALRVGMQDAEEMVRTVCAHRLTTLKQVIDSYASDTAIGVRHAVALHTQDRQILLQLASDVDEGIAYVAIVRLKGGRVRGGSLFTSETLS